MRCGRRSHLLLLNVYVSLFVVCLRWDWRASKSRKEESDQAQEKEEVGYQGGKLTQRSHNDKDHDAMPVAEKR